MIFWLDLTQTSSSAPIISAKILNEFAKDEKLGIAGGGFYVEKNGRFVLEKVADYHVRGRLKMYCRKCLEEIGSLCTYKEWGTIDEVYAWKHGWKTRSFFENRVIHKRPTGKGSRQGRFRANAGRANTTHGVILCLFFLQR